MGIMKELKQRQPKPKDYARKEGERSNPFITFHPTEAEKIQMRQMPVHIGAVIELLAVTLQQDCTLSVTFKPENNAFCVMLHDRAKPFGEREVLTAWHADLEMALRAMAFALETRWKGFPYEVPQRQSAVDNSW